MLMSMTDPTDETVGQWLRSVGKVLLSAIPVIVLTIGAVYRRPPPAASARSSANASTARGSISRPNAVVTWGKR